MKVWIVEEVDYDNSYIVGVYSSAELAAEHHRRQGGHVSEYDIYDVVVVEDESAKMAAEAEKSHQGYLEQRAREASDHQRVLTYVIDPTRRQKLCHCSVFSSDGYFITANGYCRYCGGWEPVVYRKHMGESVFAQAISELDLRHRTRMREMHP